MTKVGRKQLESLIDEQAIIIEEQATELRTLKLVLAYLKGEVMNGKEEQCPNCEACVCGSHRVRKDRGGQASGDRHSFRVS